MALFLGRHVHKMDRKGRVSVPAAFRAALSGQLEHGIVAVPSFKLPAIDCYGFDKLEELSRRLDGLAAFSEERDDFAAAIFGSAIQLPLDGEGRIVLPEAVVAHAHIADAVAFIGAGRTFSLWEPKAAEAHLAEAAQRAVVQGRVLKPEAPR